MYKFIQTINKARKETNSTQEEFVMNYNNYLVSSRSKDSQQKKFTHFQEDNYFQFSVINMIRNFP